MVFGIDFGTAHCAVVSCEITAVTDPHPEMIDRMREVSFWGERSVKTQLAWHPKRKEWLWGPSVDICINNRDIPESSRLEMIKLGLDNSTHTQLYRTRLQEKINNLPTECNSPSCEDLISIFLTRVWDHVKSRMAAKIGSSAVLSADKVALSVPASWDYDIVAKMIDAAIKAGIPNVELASEPEAAAVCLTLQRMNSLGTTSLGCKEAFLVADIGAGTGVNKCSFQSLERPPNWSQDFITYIAENQEGLIKMAEGVTGAGLLGWVALLSLDG